MSTTPRRNPPPPTSAHHRDGRALRENWGLRRIQSYVETAIKGGSATEPITETNPALPATAPPARDKGAESGGVHEPRDVCSSSSDRLTLYLSRLKEASSHQLEAARGAIDDIRLLIEAQLLRSAGTKGHAS